MSTMTSIAPILFFPADGDRPPEPVPAIMTAEEVVRFLRLDSKGEHAVSQALKRLKREGLKAYRVGKRNKYWLVDVVKWVESRREEAVR